MKLIPKHRVAPLVNEFPAGELARPDGASSARPALSLILCSRNDCYMGNSRWRLRTSIEFAAASVEASGHSGEVEVLVADWGSEIPLADTIELSPRALAVTRFLWIPPETAIPAQRDSEFPEVIALNAAARRASGEFIGRIDQDTLVGHRFFEWFFAMKSGRSDPPIPSGEVLMFANRRRIPYRIATQLPRFVTLRHLIRQRGDRLALELHDDLPYWSQAVGVWLARREVWHECGGYDERFIHHNWMETEMIVRLRSRYPIVDLGKMTGYDFYHLAHDNPFRRGQGRSAKRKRNRPVDTEARVCKLNPNGLEWGLARASLEVVRGTRVVSSTATDDERGATAGLARLNATAGAQTAIDWIEAKTFRLIQLGRSARPR